jgi:hypothetical protein
LTRILITALGLCFVAVIVVAVMTSLSFLVTWDFGEALESGVGSLVVMLVYLLFHLWRERRRGRKD